MMFLFTIFIMSYESYELVSFDYCVCFDHNKNSLQLCKRLGITREDYDKLLNDALKEFQTRKVEVRFFKIWAQKIES